MRIADFTDREKWVVRTTLEERWGADAVELHAAEVGLRLQPGDAEEAACPALFWSVDRCSFVVIKVAEGRYRCSFFYGDLQQLAPDVAEYTELAECIVQLLQVQSDHARARAGMP